MLDILSKFKGVTPFKVSTKLHFYCLRLLHIIFFSLFLKINWKLLNVFFVITKMAEKGLKIIVAIEKH